MTWRAYLISLIAGMVGAAIVVTVGLVWNASSQGRLVRALIGVTSDQPRAVASAQPTGAPSSAASWRIFAGKNGYNPACDYRFHLLIPAEKAAKMSIDLSRYADASSFIYPTIASKHFLQAVIMEPGEPIAVDMSDANGGDCDAGNASLGNLPGMCFETRIEERCP
jgi:hypothetical protein